MVIMAFLCNFAADINNITQRIAIMKTNLLQAIGRWVMTGFLLLLFVNANAADRLFQNGKSKYRIVVSAEASTSEQTAARELQQYIRQISGAQLPITSDLKAKGPKIIVGYNDRVAELTGAEKPDTNDESFTYRS